MKEKLLKIFRFLISKLFLFNMLGAVAFFVVAFIALNIYLKKFTEHGVTVTVPNIIGVQTDEAIKVIEDGGFAYVILDTVFDDNVDKGAIV
ncbi:MAG: hypothetical protein C0596_18955 [Marinilabiliales bacterium]|nr:MAG: hypothetical protein C0596_18955 [Marinilabiliales bacterium]